MTYEWYITNEHDGNHMLHVVRSDGQLGKYWWGSRPPSQEKLENFNYHPIEFFDEKGLTTARDRAIIKKLKGKTPSENKSRVATNSQKGIDTMTTTKTTKRDNFNALLAIAEVQANPVLVDFINHELELLDRKNSSNTGRKPSEKQVANGGLRDAIVAAMEPGKLYTLSQLAELVPGLEDAKSQRMVGLVNPMTNDESKGRTGCPINKVMDKRKAYYTLA